MNILVAQNIHITNIALMEGGKARRDEGGMAECGWRSGGETKAEWRNADGGGVERLSRSGGEAEWRLDLKTTSTSRSVLEAKRRGNPVGPRLLLVRVFACANLLLVRDTASARHMKKHFRVPNTWHA